jgi:hypothetical protein
LKVEVDAAILGTSAFPIKKRKREEVVFLIDTELDSVLISAMEAGKDQSRKSTQLFGRVLQHKSRDGYYRWPL